MERNVDSKNKYAHLIFHLKDGSQVSSRETHFHDIPLDNIQKIEAKFKYYTHILDKDELPKEFKEFIHFRSGGVTFAFNGTDVYDKRPILTWSLGWTDGKTEYIQEYKFKNGEVLREYTVPRDTKCLSHFHPDSRGTSP